jgi:hypothetical protein
LHTPDLFFPGAFHTPREPLWTILFCAVYCFLVNSYLIHDEPTVKRISLLLMLLWVFGPPSAVFAQTETGAICVATFADANGNGIRDPGEELLPGVNVNLATGGVIIATHIMAIGETQYCFENLLTGYYTITFTDSPMYRTTSASEGTFSLDAGQRLMINEFGAFPIPISSLRAEVAAQIAAAQEPEEPLATSTRLMLATVGSMAVMLFMVGLGLDLGVISGRLARPGQPESISPRR